MTAPFFRVADLTHRFGGLVAIDGLSFTVERGTIFSVIGPNGSGKTTLFNCICSIYKPTSGSIWLGDERISGKKPHQIARLGIARTFQNIELFANVSTVENLMLGRHLHMTSGLWQGAAMCYRRSKAAQEECTHREHVERIIDLLELQAVRDKLVRELPFGTQRTVELGRALALEPTLLLLDEPAAGMSLDERQDLMFWIKDIQTELGVTILLIEHQMQMVMDISDRVLAINFGKPIIEGTPKEVADHPEVIEAYMGGASVGTATQAQ